MSDKPPLLTDVHFEQTPERLKVVLPVKRNIPLLILYTVLVLIWLAMMVGGIIYTIRIAFSGQPYAFVFTVMLLVLLSILYRFGRYLLRQWANLATNREILFINKDVLIVRRPISIFGNTDAYDMQHVTPFYISEKPAGPAFDYGYRHYYFGEALSPQTADELIRFLNETYFPNAMDYDEDDDE
ncbi:MAG: hypothetical protein R3C44_05650 [Chloroflexota bacterium]